MLPQGWERDANRFAEELYEAEKKEAQRKKIEELEAMRVTKPLDLARLSATLTLEIKFERNLAQACCVSLLHGWEEERAGRG